MLDDIIMQIIESMKPDAEQLKREYEKGSTKDLQNCPNYKTVRAYCDAVKALNKLTGGYMAYATPRSVLIQMGVKHI